MSCQWTLSVYCGAFESSFPNANKTYFWKSSVRDSQCFLYEGFPRSHVWWPGLDKLLDKQALSCPSCQSVKQSPASAPLHPWIWPSQPWKRIRVDFAGPFHGYMYLIIRDAHSKWSEVVEMSSTTASKTINVLRHLFASYGLLKQVVSDYNHGCSFHMVCI